jgi:hypothetical protein
MERCLFSVLIILLFASCESKKDKFIQSELDKLTGMWEVNTFNIAGQVPDSLNNFVKSGKINFRKCGYDKKSFQSDSRVCDSEIEINSSLLGMGYRYDASAKLFDIKYMGLFSSNPISEIKVLQKLELLMVGTWDMSVVGNSLTAKQVKNANNLNIQVSFTATRK